MKVSLTLAVAAVVGCCLAAPANAGYIATLTALYDPLGDNTSFTVTNLSGGTLTNVTLTTTLGPDIVALADLAPGASETYDFGASGLSGFIASPHNVGVPDTTQYQFSVVSNGNLLVSDLFSPITNSTSSYVDFLGNTCPFDSCGGTVAEGGLVAAVPEPASLSLLGAGVIGLAVKRRRRSDAAR